MRVLVQVASQVRPGVVPSQVLKYDVTYNRRLGVACWQLLPGQRELIPAKVKTTKGEDEAHRHEAVGGRIARGD